jgi:hypothetical protein
MCWPYSSNTKTFSRSIFGSKTWTYASSSTADSYCQSTWGGDGKNYRCFCG